MRLIHEDDRFLRYVREGYCEADPIRQRSASLIWDPENQNIYLTLRTSLRSIESEGAIEHLDQLTQRSMGIEHWYGGVEDEHSDAKEKRVIIYLRPEVQYAAAE